VQDLENMVSQFRMAAAAMAVAVLTPAIAQASYLYNPGGSEHAARTWREMAPQMAPQVPAQAALNPYGGPTVIASRPVPDTPRDRALYGQPMSQSGRMTAPIGD
jgi:hypothetical protein